MLLLALGLATLPGSPASAQTNRVVLPGHIPTAAAAAQRLGSVDSHQTLTLALTLPLRNTDQLADLLRGLYDPKDSRFGHYLSPDEFTARFGPTAEDYAAVAEFARAHGLQVTAVHPNRTILEVAGPVQTVEETFGVNLGRYQSTAGRQFYAPDAEPSVPAALFGRVSGVLGLDSASTRHPLYRVRRHALVPLATSALTGPAGGLAPTGITTAYNLNTVKETGSGQTLGLFELDGYTSGDITAYEDQFGLPHVLLQNILVGGFNGKPTATEGPLEVTLDIDMQAALAPNAAKILVYEAPNTDAGLIACYNKIASDNLAKEISTSWADYETATSAQIVSSENKAFMQMAAQGQSIYAASGDTGSYADGANLVVLDPGSQPYMVGVGGTTLSTNTDGSYASETTWNDYGGDGSGGGISMNWAIPSYQAGVVSPASLGSTTMRNVPDVSLDADPASGYDIYASEVDPNTGASYGWFTIGGTSAAAPLWAAFTALVNQRRVTNGKPILGFANPAIYATAKGSHYGIDFHDIADGSDNDTSDNDTYYPAVTGYDDATGWGSFQGANLLADLAVYAVGPPTAHVSAISRLYARNTGTTMIVAGTGFVQGSVITFNGTALKTTFVSSTQLTGVVPASLLAKPGTAIIGVTNPGNAQSNLLSAPIYPSLISLTVTPGSISGGLYATGVATLAQAAPSGGEKVTLSSSAPTAASVPASVTIAVGALSVSFPITTYTVTTPAMVTIQAQAGTTFTAPLTVH